MHAPAASPLPVIQEEQPHTGANGTQRASKADEPGFVEHDENDASHRDDLQVKLDVDRSMVHLPQGGSGRRDCHSQLTLLVHRRHSGQAQRAAVQANHNDTAAVPLIALFPGIAAN